MDCTIVESGKSPDATVSSSICKTVELEENVPNEFVYDLKEAASLQLRAQISVNALYIKEVRFYATVIRITPQAHELFSVRNPQNAVKINLGFRINIPQSDIIESSLYVFGPEAFIWMRIGNESVEYINEKLNLAPDEVSAAQCVREEPFLILQLDRMSAAKLLKSDSGNLLPTRPLNNDLLSLIRQRIIAIWRNCGDKRTAKKSTTPKFNQNESVSSNYSSSFTSLERRSPRLRITLKRRNTPNAKIDDSVAAACVSSTSSSEMLYECTFDKPHLYQTANERPEVTTFSEIEANARNEDKVAIKKKKGRPTKNAGLSKTQKLITTKTVTADTTVANSVNLWNIHPVKYTRGNGKKKRPVSRKRTARKNEQRESTEAHTGLTSDEVTYSSVNVNVNGKRNRSAPRRSAKRVQASTHTVNGNNSVDAVTKSLTVDNTNGNGNNETSTKEEMILVDGQRNAETFTVNNSLKVTDVSANKVTDALPLKTFMVKIVFEDDLRKRMIPADMSFESLEKVILTLFHLTPDEKVKLKYVDQEGEMVTIGDTCDVRLALCTVDNLKINVSLIPKSQVSKTVNKEIKIEVYDLSD